MKDAFEGTVDFNENDLTRKIIEQNLKENQASLEAYQKKVQEGFLETFKIASDGFLNVKNLFNFFLWV